MLRNRLTRLEEKLGTPGPAPVVIVEEGQPVPEGARIVIWDDIPKQPIRINKIN